LTHCLARMELCYFWKRTKLLWLLKRLDLRFRGN